MVARDPAWHSARVAEKFNLIPQYTVIIRDRKFGNPYTEWLEPMYKYFIENI